MIQKLQTPVWHYVTLAIVVVLQSFAIVSIVLRTTYLPIFVGIYPNIVSVAAYFLPVVVGLLTERVENAVLLAVAPVVVLIAIYQAIYPLPWFVDLNTLGDLAGQVAGPIFLFGGLATIGWLLRRSILNSLTSRSSAQNAK